LSAKICVTRWQFKTIAKQTILVVIKNIVVYATNFILSMFVFALVVEQYLELTGKIRKDEKIE